MATKKTAAKKSPAPKMNDTTKNLRYAIYPMSDYPYNPHDVAVAVRRGDFRNRQAVLIRASGLVFSPTRTSHRDVREFPHLFSVFGKLTGIKQKELREARQEYLTQQARLRESDAVTSLRADAKRYGFRLVKE